MGEGVEELKAPLRPSGTGSGSGASGQALPQTGRGTPELGRGKVGVAQWEQHPISPLLAGGQAQLPGQRGGAGDDL